MEHNGEYMRERESENVIWKSICKNELLLEKLFVCECVFVCVCVNQTGNIIAKGMTRLVIFRIISPGPVDL